MIKTTIKSLGLLLVFSMALLQSCVRQEEFPAGTKLICGAEKRNKKGDKFLADNDSTRLFDGGKKQTSKEFHSGKYAVYVTPKKAFAFAFRIKHAGPDWYFKVSVWRKSRDGKGVLVAASETPKLLYQTAKTVVETDENGWEKLEMEVYSPPGFGSDGMKFYIWNNGSDTVFFDDISIQRLPHKWYPTYKEAPLSIILDTSQYLKILEKRKEAFKYGILQTEDKDWVKGIVFGEGKMMKAKLRLKGDWLDHLKGNKWSFRIKMRKGNAWKRLREFSVQTPEARNYLWEWVAHRFCQKTDILTTRYGFTPLVLNNASRGFYAWEEHFVKQLLEWRKRREGPIVKFSEEPFWQLRRQEAGLKQEAGSNLPFLETSVIRPFKSGKIINNPVLYAQFLNAQKLMQQYKKHERPPADIFDIDKLAAHYAMLELNQARHGMAWHNHRYYFNPVICKLEPIAYDGYADYTHPKTGIENNFAWNALTNRTAINQGQYLMDVLMLDTVFSAKYLYYLEKFSDPEFISSMMGELRPEIEMYDSLINLEFEYVHFDTSFYRRSAESIRSYLPLLKDSIEKIQHEPGFSFIVRSKHYSDTTIFEKTPEFYVNAFVEQVIDDSLRIRLFNYTQRNIIILGTGPKKKYVQNFQLPEPRLQAFFGDTVRELDILTDTGSNFLFFMIEGRFETYVVPIIHWPHPEGITPQQELMAKVNLDNPIVFDRLEGNDLYIRKDSIRIDFPIVIPEGYRVHFEAGTVLDMVDKALFLSYSPVIMEGTEQHPVVITSSDFSANGFTILQAKERSKLRHVVIENMNTLDLKGWVLTGALTFYESDVDIENTTFYRNQCEDALNIIRSDFHLDRSSFDHIFGDAFDSDFSTGLVSNTVFTNIGNDAIDFSGSQIKIKDTRIEEVEDKGISGGEESHLVVENTTITNANIGLASKDLSVVKVANSRFIDCKYGLVLLQKKPEYGPATVILKNTKIIRPQTEMLIEVGSKVKINGKTIKGDLEKLADVFY